MCDSHRGDSHVCMILPENLCNWSYSLCALLILEETPYPLPVDFLTDGLTHLTRQYLIMVDLDYPFILILSYTSDPSLSGSPFRLDVPYQACMVTPLP